MNCRWGQTDMSSCEMCPVFLLTYNKCLGEWEQRKIETVWTSGREWVSVRVCVSVRAYMSCLRVISDKGDMMCQFVSLTPSSSLSSFRKGRVGWRWGVCFGGGWLCPAQGQASLCGQRVTRWSGSSAGHCASSPPLLPSADKAINPSLLWASAALALRGCLLPTVLWDQLCLWQGDGAGGGTLNTQIGRGVQT